MKCPHCLENFFEKWENLSSPPDDVDGSWLFQWAKCPACKRNIMRLGNTDGSKPMIFDMVRPRAPARSPLPPDVPDAFADDYREACMVLADSPKASAALSRRCLQNLLRAKAGVKPSDLSKEIEEAMKSAGLPSQLSELLDAVRHIGNFGAHPIKSNSTGEIVDVEPLEAEWSLDVLEGLFDFFFVQPAVLRRKKDALNQKLQDAGKPQLP